ncbi:MAG: hypothetical protein ACK4I0_10980 [Brevundimonas sp.]|uniref:hypothetical protein n=1 Tax=Brevundimonas sp. TaxID=1871086 RepID=UPI00391957C5
MTRVALFALTTSALALTACGQPAPSEPAAPAAAPAAPAAAPAPAPAGLEAALRAMHADDGDLTYAFAPIDLNGDGADEALAYVMGPMVCGSGGCNLYVMAREGEGWRMAARTTVTRTPIGVLPTSTNGWRDLAVSVGGGGAEAGSVRLAFDGRTYAANPTTAPAAPLGAGDQVDILIPAVPDARPLP